MLKTVKGAKGGSKNQRQPKVANDTTASKTYARLQYGMSEGEVEGLANGFKSIFLDDTPVENDSGARNFQDVTLDFRSGTNDQAYMEGFESIASETAVGVELKSDTPWVKGITNLNLDAVIVRVRFGALKQQDPSNGDVSGIVIDYLIEVQTDGGSWELMLDTQMSGKTSANYERTHRMKAYDDGVGVWTIGFGTIKYPNGVRVKKGDTCTEPQAEEYLHNDLVVFENAINRLVKVPLNQNQFDALASFTYNLGEGNLSKSTLLKKLNAKDYKGAAAEFPKWNKAGGRVLAGLVKRRKAEMELFLK